MFDISFLFRLVHAHRVINMNFDRQFAPEHSLIVNWVAHGTLLCLVSEIRHFVQKPENL